MTLSSAAPLPFSRDRYTWLAYWMGAYYAYLQAAMGPAMPALRRKLDMSYTLGSYHFSAFALGMILAGLVGARVTARLGRTGAFWGGAGGMAVGAGLFVLGSQPTLTIAASLLMGAWGSLLMQNVRASISDHHPQHRSVAVAESNIILGLGAGSAALAIGLWGWEAAFGVGMVACLVLAASYYQTPIPPAPVPQSAQRERLPLVVWAFWGVMLLGAAVEWSVNFWGASYLESAAGLPPSQAASFMSLYFLAFIAGRAVCSWAVRYLTAERLLLAMLIVAVGGFSLFWANLSAPITIAGLLVIGFGIAFLTPLVMAISLHHAPHAANAVSARISLAAGLAILTAPQALGRLADATDLQTAYGVVGGLLLAVIVLALWANRWAAVHA
jgi:fucose permease